MLLGDVYTDLAHGLNGARVDLVCWVYARAVDLEAVPGQVPEEPFGHLAPCRVLGAQEQHLLLPHRLSSSSVHELRLHPILDTVPHPAEDRQALLLRARSL